MLLETQSVPYAQRLALERATVLRRSIVRVTVLCQASSTLALLLAANSLPSQEIAALNSPTELTKLSIKDLMNLPVTTVSREPEPWFTSPSAIQVLTEDIRRSSASSIPEALRLAPNLQVAPVNSGLG